MSLEKQLYNEHILILRKRFDEIISNHECNKILIHSGTTTYAFLDDHDYPFRPNPHFVYWLPLTNHPNSFILLEEDKKPTLFYYQFVDYWYDQAGDPDGIWLDLFDVKIVRSMQEIRQALPKDLSDVAYIGEFAETLAGWNFQSVNNAKLLNEIHYYRAYKSAYEKHCVLEANRIAVKGYGAVEKAFYAGATEIELNAEYLKAAGILERNVPYTNIVGINQHGAVLHYTDCQHNIGEEAHSLLIDVGAKYNGYCSDITRTYAKDKLSEFAEMIERFDKEELAIIDFMKTGRSYVDVHMYSHERVASVLSDYKFVNLSTEEIVETGISRTFMPHGIGHFLGIQTHDIAGHQHSVEGKTVLPPAGHESLRCTRNIEIGNLHTIEPGLYFIPQLLETISKTDHSKHLNWEKINEFKKYGGIRIEDDIYMGENGLENLTRIAFSE